jgi:hypothetical protein
MSTMLPRAVLRALLAGRAAWWAPGLVSAVVSAIIGPCLTQLTVSDLPAARRAAAAAGTDPEEFAVIGTSLAAIVGVCGVVVISLVASAAVRQLTRDLARWRISGAGSGTVGAFVATQLLLVSLAGGVLGAAATVVAGEPFAQFVSGMVVPALGDLAIPVPPAVFASTALAPVLAAILGGLLPVLHAVRVPAVRAVARDDDAQTEPRRSGLGASVRIRRWILPGLGLLVPALVTWRAYASPPAGIDDAASTGMGLGALVVIGAAVGARRLMPALAAGWTRLVPLRTAGWRLARASAIAKTRLSGATIVAMACGITCLGVLMGIGYSAEAVERAAGSAEAYNFTDIQVISVIVGTMCAVGGVCVLALASADRRHETAILRASGMRAGQIVGMAFVEAVVLSATALLIALLATVLAAGLIPLAATEAGLPPGFVLPWAELGLAFTASVTVVAAALVVPAVQALRTCVRTALAET